MKLFTCSLCHHLKLILIFATYTATTYFLCFVLISIPYVHILQNSGIFICDSYKKKYHVIVKSSIFNSSTLYTFLSFYIDQGPFRFFFIWTDNFLSFCITAVVIILFYHMRCFIFLIKVVDKNMIMSYLITWCMPVCVREVWRVWVGKRVINISCVHVWLQSEIT